MGRWPEARDRHRRATGCRGDPQQRFAHRAIDALDQRGAGVGPRPHRQHNAPGDRG